MKSKKHSLSRKINHILHPVKPRPIIKQPLAIWYVINDIDRYIIKLSEINLNEVFELPIDPETCEPVQGKFRFFYTTLTIPALTKSIVTEVVFIPDDLDKYTYIRANCIIYLTNYEKTLEYKDFSRKRGYWYY